MGIEDFLLLIPGPETGWK